MRIVFLLQASSSVLKGGSEIQADYIMNEILGHGHDVYYVSDKIGPETGPRLEGVKYVFLKSYGTKYSFRNALPLVRILKTLNPDLIYQRWRTPYTGIAAWYAKKFGKKLVFNMANAQDPMKNRIPLNARFLANRISEHLGRYGVARADVVIAQNHEQQEALRKHFSRESIVIPNGHPVPVGPFPKSAIPVVVWVANIKPLKRLEIFLELAGALQGARAKFVYAGRADSGSYQKKIDRMAGSLTNVTYAGELSQEKANHLIGSSSLLVNTSRQEGFPNTFIQAWMRETPVVSLNVDPDGLLKERKIGFFSGTFEQFVKDVRFLIDHEEARAAQGKTARQYAVEHHNIEIAGSRYLKIFEELVK